MRKAIITGLLGWTTLLGQVTAIAAPPRTAGARGASVPSADSLSGVAVQCADFLGGPALVFPAQRIRGDGTVDAAWSNTARLCIGVSGGTTPVLVGDGAGGMIAVWVDERRGEADLRAQRFTIDGAIAPGWPADGVELCIAPAAQQSPAACPDGAGGAIVVWQDFRSDGSGDLRGQHIASTGALLWEAPGLILCAANGEQGSPSCASDGSGGAFVAWQDRRDEDATIRVMRVDPAGQVMAAERGISTGSRPHRAPQVVADGANGAYLAWLVGAGRVFVLRTDSQAGVASGWPAAGLELSGAAALVGSFSLVAHDTAGVSLVWSDRARGNGDIVAQRVRRDGSIDWVAGGVAMSDDDSEQFAPVAVGDGTGGLIAAWEDHRAGPADIVAARISEGGALAWDSAGVPVCRLPGEQFDAAVVSDGEGGAIITWSDARYAGRARLARGRQSIGGPSPRLDRVETGPGRVRFVYRTEPGDARTMDWSRRAGAEPEWQVLKRLQPAADGSIDVEDRTVSPGLLARYRLSQPVADGELLFDETSVEIPVAMPLGLRSARVEGGWLRVSFSLSSEDPARLEVLDVQGRRVWHEAVGHLGAGEHDRRFAFGHSAGHYFVRLLQRRETRTLRMVVIR